MSFSFMDDDVKFFDSDGNLDKGVFSSFEAALMALVEERADGPGELGGLVEDVVAHGALSGLLPGIVYYEDTNNFFEAHKDSLFEYFNDLSNDIGQPYDDFLGLTYEQNGFDKVLTDGDRNRIVVSMVEEFASALQFQGFSDQARSAQEILDELNESGHSL